MAVVVMAVVVVAMVVVAMVVVAMVVVAVVVVAMVVVAMVVVTMIAVEFFFQLSFRRQQAPSLVGQFTLQRSNLVFDAHQRFRHATLGHNAKWICRRDEVVIGQTKFSIRSGVTRRPIKLLGVELHAEGVL